MRVRPDIPPTPHDISQESRKISTNSDSTAHWIRNEDTKQFRAVNSLHTERRWCLTGTPIQNRLEDLRSLVQFLKVDPFVAKLSKANFKKHIIDPLFSDDDDPCRNLRLLLRLLCLRRTKQTESNLRVNTQIVTLTLSPTERSLYNGILEETKRDMDVLVSTESSIQKYTQLFTAILRLRILCDQGTFYTGASSTLSPMPVSPERSPYGFRLGSEFACDFCRSEESLDLMKDRNFCWNCSRPLRQLSVDYDAPGSMQESPEPTTPSSIQRFYLGNKLSYSGSQSPTRSPWESCVPDEGFSTKLLAVVENLKDNAHTSKRFVVETITYGWYTDQQPLAVSSSHAGQKRWIF
jgi:hypothetical protein